LARDPLRYVVTEVVLLAASILMGVSFGFLTMGIAEFIGANTVVVAGAGLVVGVGVGTLTLLDMHKVNVRLHGSSGGSSGSSGGDGGDGKGDDKGDGQDEGMGDGIAAAGARLAVELARLASALGLKFRVLRVASAGDYDSAGPGSTAAVALGVQQEFLETFRPLSQRQLSALFGRAGDVFHEHAGPIHS
jgi:hypothetical protein